MWSLLIVSVSCLLCGSPELHTGPPSSITLWRSAELGSQTARSGSLFFLLGLCLHEERSSSEKYARWTVTSSLMGTPFPLGILFYKFPLHPTSLHVFLFSLQNLSPQCSTSGTTPLSTSSNGSLSYFTFNNGRHTLDQERRLREERAQQ